MQLRRTFIVRTLVAIVFISLAAVLLIRPPAPASDIGGQQDTGGREYIGGEYVERFQADSEVKTAEVMEKIVVEGAKPTDFRAKPAESTGGLVERSDVVTVMDTKMDGTVENITYSWRDVLGIHAFHFNSLDAWLILEGIK